MNAFRSSFDGEIERWMQTDVGQTQQLLDQFREAGFGASRIERAEMCHNDITWVFEHKKGIPITMGILVIEAARRFDLLAYGLNFPGHFLVSIEDQLVDPIDMRVVLPDEIKAGAHSLEDLLAPATSTMVALRMLNNIKALHVQIGDLHEALEIVDYQVAVDPDNRQSVSSLDFERGELWQQLGAFTAAKAAFIQCAETSPTARLADRAQQCADALTGKDEIWH